MKVFEYAKLNNVSSAEIKKKFDLPSHLSVIPKELLIEPESKEETATKPILTVPEVPMEDKIKSCRGLGTKSPYWKELNA